MIIPGLEPTLFVMYVQSIQKDGKVWSILKLMTRVDIKYL